MNKKKVIVIGLALVAVMSGCGKTEPQINVQESVVEETTVAQTMETIAAEEIKTEADTTEVTAVDGIVLDAAMHSMEIQSTDGITLSFVIPDEVDVSALANGLMIGKAICVSYTGTIEGDNTDTAEITKIADSTLTPSLNVEQLSFAAEIILAVKYKDMETLSNLVTYPIQLDSAEPKTVDSKEDFLTLVTDEIMNEDMVEAVTKINLFHISKVEEGIVLGSEKQKIVFAAKGGKYGITGIKYE